MATSKWATKSLSIHSASLDRRGRLSLPSQALQPLTWLNSDMAIDCLAVLDEPGHLVIQPLELYDTQIQDAIKSAEHDEDNETLRALADVFRPLRLPRDRRPTLDNIIVMHLGLAPGYAAHLYVHRVENYLEVLTIDYRNSLILGANSTVSTILML